MELEYTQKSKGFLNLVLLNPLPEIEFSGSQSSDDSIVMEMLINTDVCELPPEIQI